MKFIIITIILLFLIYPFTCFLETDYFEISEKECFFETAFLNNINSSTMAIVSFVIFFAFFIFHKTYLLSVSRLPLNFLDNFKIPIITPQNLVYSQAIIDPQE